MWSVLTIRADFNSDVFSVITRMRGKRLHFKKIIPGVRVGYEMVDSGRGA